MRSMRRICVTGSEGIESMNIIVSNKGQRIYVQSPYDPQFIAGAKRIAGRWDSTDERWLFPAAQRERVMSLLDDVYGWDPDSADERVTVRLTADKEISVEHDGVRVAGVTIARATGRDSGARLGDGVILVSGSAGSGGSRKYWRTRVRSGSVFEVDFPKAAAERLVENPGEWASAEIIGPSATWPTQDELCARRKALAEELEDIDRQIAE